jgi:hypothetical protein
MCIRFCGIGRPQRRGFVAEIQDIVAKRVTQTVSHSEFFQGNAKAEKLNVDLVWCLSIYTSHLEFEALPLKTGFDVQEIYRGKSLYSQLTPILEIETLISYYIEFGHCNTTQEV